MKVLDSAALRITVRSITEEIRGKLDNILFSHFMTLEYLSSAQHHLVRLVGTRVNFIDSLAKSEGWPLFLGRVLFHSTMVTKFLYFPNCRLLKVAMSSLQINRL